MGEAIKTRRGGGVFEPVFDSFTQAAQFNEANLAFVGNSNSYGARPFTVLADNEFVYVGVDGTTAIRKWHKGNLAFSAGSISIARDIRLAQDNDFIYAGGSTNSGDGSSTKIYKLLKSNMSLNLVSSNSYGDRITSLQTDDSFVYIAGHQVRTVQKYHKGNLVFVGNTNSFGRDIESIAIDNDFIYAGGSVDQTVKKWHKGNLVYVGVTGAYGNEISSIAVDNEFLYVGGAGNFSTHGDVKKYHKGNLVYVGNTPRYQTSNPEIAQIFVDNGFIYVGGTDSSSIHTVKKYDKSTLAFVANTNTYGGRIRTLFVDNEFMYVAGDSSLTIKKWTARQEIASAINDPEGKIVYENGTYIKEEYL